MTTILRPGDYTNLAEGYAKHRPSYSASVLDCILGLLEKPRGEVEAADVGAGTGIWTRLLAQRVKNVTAVEPNDDMRRVGARDCVGYPVTYRQGTGEETGLPSASVDLVSMASSFHWVDFDRGIQEFHRILRPHGRFVAVWNPRMLDDPLQREIDAEAVRLKPDLKRVSSGNSGITEVLTERLLATSLFDDVVYLEARHCVSRTPQEYVEVWQTVNDIQVQLGPEKWAEFLAFIERKTSGLSAVVTTYRTRAWAGRRTDT